MRMYNWELAVDRYMHPRMTGMHNKELGVDRYMHPRMTGMHNDHAKSIPLYFFKYKILENLKTRSCSLTFTASSDTYPT